MVDYTEELEHLIDALVQTNFGIRRVTISYQSEDEKQQVREQTDAETVDVDYEVYDVNYNQPDDIRQRLKEKRIPSSLRIEYKLFSASIGLEHEELPSIFINFERRHVELDTTQYPLKQELERLITERGYTFSVS